jgi:hypothetical protein
LCDAVGVWAVAGTKSIFLGVRGEKGEIPILKVDDTLNPYLGHVVEVE